MNIMKTKLNRISFVLSGGFAASSFILLLACLPSLGGGMNRPIKLDRDSLLKASLDLSLVSETLSLIHI